ncbi:CDP-alcohol phosphatidyltransferase family protein [Candidatus Woesearchaeota archaeon]|nr:CDP-alcohol phosphatidyltransferase family protein [Candidatus Woesearchaeota archaeon]
MGTIKKLRPVGGWIIQKTRVAYLLTWMHPNAITILNLISGFLVFYFIYRQQFLSALICIGLSIFFDLMDGAVARITGKKTSFGGYLDPIVDKTVEFLIYLGFSINFPLESFAAMGASFLIGDAKTWAYTQKSLPGNFDWPGIGDKGDRYIVLILGIIFFIIFQKAIYLQYSLIAISILGFLGFLSRVLYARKILRDNHHEGNE